MINEMKSVIEKHKDHIPVVAVAELLAVIDGAEAKGNVAVFDWLREQFGKIIGEVHSPADVVWNNAVKMCIEKVNEAEAKWEADCCEWKPAHLHGRTVFCNCFTRYDVLNKVDVECFTFCPYCGKSIKISEVE